MKYIIVAYDKNRLIGGNNTLLWQDDMPVDMKRFRELTTDNVVIMGRKTYDSIGHPLPNRQNIVITRQDMQIEGAVVVDSLKKAYQAAEAGKDIYVIGGGQIFAESLSDIDRILATEIEASFEGDIYFSELPDGWVEVSRVKYSKDEMNKYDYSFVDYIKQQ